MSRRIQKDVGEGGPRSRGRGPMRMKEGDYSKARRSGLEGLVLKGFLEGAMGKEVGLK